MIDIPVQRSSAAESRALAGEGREGLAATTGGESPSVESWRAKRKTLWVAQESPESSTAFALVLAGYGDAWATVALGRGMGPEHTLLALQPPDDDEPMAEVRTAADLAERYVRALRAVRPRGPYFLGGYSAGALLALEMARLLREQGHDVPLLVMLDPLFVRYSRLEQFSWYAFDRIVKLLTPLLGRVRYFKILTAMTEDEGLQRHLRLLRNHAPQPYPGRVTLVEARGSLFLRPPTFIAQWRRVAMGGLDRHRPGGTHHSFMRPPHVGELGQHLAASMRRLAPSNGE